MVAVLDQYEVEYKETYTSGTYDQVVMGKMFYETKNRSGEKVYVYGNRGVVYGSINSDQAPVPGTSIFDSSNSTSYSLQPYREKAGNSRTAKFICNEERIYDSLVPDPIPCFKINGAKVFSANDSDRNEMIGSGHFKGIDLKNNAFIMLNGYYPSHSNDLNIGIDNHWTKSYPFEPRYSRIARQQTINFSDVETTHVLNFGSATATVLPRKVKKKGLFIAWFARSGSNLGSASGKDFDYSSPLSGRWNHFILADGPRVSVNSTIQITGSANSNDVIKTLFGFGDSTTTFFDSQVTDTNNSTGYSLKGANNFVDFRAKKNVIVNTSSGFYYEKTGSTFCFSPIIRGWKYGLYNGLPDYTATYYRQGRYGQYRDMLEQRIYTRIFHTNSDRTISTTSEVNDGPITVKFVDSNDNLVDPQNTQSQNLSLYATSSLPYFDLESRNRPEFNLQLTNLGLINVALDALGNITV